MVLVLVPSSAYLCPARLRIFKHYIGNACVINLNKRYVHLHVPGYNVQSFPLYSLFLFLSDFIFWSYRPNLFPATDHRTSSLPSHFLFSCFFSVRLNSHTLVGGLNRYYISYFQMCVFIARFICPSNCFTHARTHYTHTLHTHKHTTHTPQTHHTHTHTQAHTHHTHKPHTHTTPTHHTHKHTTHTTHTHTTNTNTHHTHT